MESRKVRASIDIGTNSVLLLVAEISEGKLKILEEKQEIPRLGRGVDQDRKLHPDSRNRVLNVLSDYRHYLEKNYPSSVDHTMVTATSAVRDSLNRDQFLNEIMEATGWRVRLLSGDAEAETTYKGAISVLKDRSHRFAVLDIGGGSTEIAIGSGEKFERGLSLDMGSVRFSERYLKQNPPLEVEVMEARTAARKLIKENHQELKSYQLVGVAGTVTSIAAILLTLDFYDADRVNGFKVKRGQISSFIQEFSKMIAEDIETKYAPFLTGRGDVITGGLIILEEFMSIYGFDELTVSTGGIRHGILI
ncbi:Ppx/GppA phosphatase family protein [Rhodohalobacter halophilus]|uniref:Ppx/GppA phosphatase family protein n=1 Tax=Rhodohalobacter halophilus TaxID=1812810 RepID=UPI00083F68F8|nr:Ppx/GppA phosphatase family protein [Rhodohalobacter halophilus]